MRLNVGKPRQYSKSCLAMGFTWHRIEHYSKPERVAFSEKLSKMCFQSRYFLCIVINAFCFEMGRCCIQKSYGEGCLEAQRDENHCFRVISKDPAGES